MLLSNKPHGRRTHLKFERLATLIAQENFGFDRLGGITIPLIPSGVVGGF